MAKTKKSPKISVIVPCYNNGLFLKDCLDSLIFQTFEDAEFIIINDGSIDNSAEIINSYANNDSRIVFIDRENKGISYSLNEGIRKAKGEYLAFLDSDDFYNLIFLEKTYEAIIRNECDLVSVDYCEFTGSLEKNNFVSEIMPCADTGNYYKIINGQNKIALKFFNHRWRTLHRKSLIIDNEIFLNENITSCEDVAFFFETVLLSKSIIYINFTGVFHRKDNLNSITKNPEGMSKNFFEGQNFLADKLKERGFWDAQKEIFLERCCFNYSFALKNLPFDYHFKFILDCSAHINKLTENFTLELNKEKFLQPISFQKLVDLALMPLEYYGWWVSWFYKVTVIMSVFNSAEFLNETLNSLISQTLKEIEIIIIDDGSTDNSLEILKYFASFDRRIVIFEQENKGAGAARNKGIANAHGVYLSFLDADDYFYPTMLEDAYKKAHTHNADIVIFQTEKYDIATEKSEYMHYAFGNYGSYLPKKEVFNLTEVANNPFYSFQGVAWDKLFSRRFINKNFIRFQEQMVSNDAYFTYISLIKARRITTLPKILIRWIIRSGVSANANISRVNHNKFPTAQLNFIRCTYDEIVKYKSELAPYWTGFAVKALSWHFFDRIDFEEIAEQVFDELADGFLEYIGFFSLPNNHVPLFFKTQYLQLLRILDFKKGEFLQYKQSLIDEPIKSKSPISKIPGQKNCGKVFFLQDPNEVVGRHCCPLFSVRIEEKDWASIVLKVQFAYLPDNKKAVIDSYNFSAYLSIINGISKLNFLQTEWDLGFPMLMDNIIFTLNANIITFYGKYIKKFSSYEFRIQLLTGREISSTFIVDILSNGDMKGPMSPTPNNVKGSHNVVKNEYISKIEELTAKVEELSEKLKKGQ
ncbi:glycosyl transferase family 2 [Clostridia bacterium]|nr:glycosyl transferase family 2 [Clostridia bacterium]